jgi:hypothetical protein
MPTTARGFDLEKIKTKAIANVLGRARSAS